MLAFVRRMIRIRKDHPAFRRRNFFQGRRIQGADVKDITWLNPDGNEMSDEEWDNSFARSLGLQMAGYSEDQYDAEGRPEIDDDFILLFNAHHEDISFTIPPNPEDVRWEVLMDTSHAVGLRPDGIFKPGGDYPLKARSMAVLINPQPDVFAEEDE